VLACAVGIGDVDPVHRGTERRVDDADRVGLAWPAIDGQRQRSKPDHAQVYAGAPESAALHSQRSSDIEAPSSP
jgi:hypothetical protein